MLRRPRLKLRCNAFGFLNEILHEETGGSDIIVICGRKNAFITLLIEEETRSPPHASAFTTPSWHIISATSSKRILYIPTLAAFRAYITSLSTLLSDSSFNPGGNLWIWNLFSLHLEDDLTGEQVEFSIQGLSQTCACLAETAWQLDMKTVVVVPDGGELLKYEVEVFSSGTKGVGGMRGRLVPLRGLLQRWFEIEEPQKSEVLQEDTKDNNEPV